ncbi:MAG TPA: DinB family protein [Actinomycetota bacterium]|nr:DinB family protein [Actinomycetota bacterium]
MPITPDTKDWTWVLERVCPECGFDTSSFPREQVSGLIRENAAQWRELLKRSDVRERPSDDVWSALEYACHVRDVFRLYDFRLHLMLDEESPDYPNWDQDAAAVEGKYGDEDPEGVADAIEEAGERLATSFDGVAGDQWGRTGNRSDGATFTVETFARYMIHDPIHHLHDVRKGYERLDSARG